jgi:NAD(P)H-dependent flavin oxidoreductase YrpB (nitropropane dioxygenase family)
VTEGEKAVRTPVCDMLGIEQPIVQAPMAAIPQLAAAVSNADALGMVTLTWSDDPGAVIRDTAKLTSRPFGGDLVLTEDQHYRLDQALEAGLRIVSFMWGAPSDCIGLNVETNPRMGESSGATLLPPWTEYPGIG